MMVGQLCALDELLQDISAPSLQVQPDNVLAELSKHIGRLSKVLLKGENVVFGGEDAALMCSAVVTVLTGMTPLAVLSLLDHAQEPLKEARVPTLGPNWAAV